MIHVWSRLVRITHALVASAIIFNFFSDTGWLHRTVGYAAACLVLLRLVDGFALLPRLLVWRSLPGLARWLEPIPTTRFWWPRLSDIKHHLAGLLDGAVEPVAGHNPLGQLAVYCMWLLILLLAFSGWLAGTEAYWGEDWPVDLHKALSRLLEALVLLHLCAVALMSKLQRQNLLWAMVSGKKPRLPSADR